MIDLRSDTVTLPTAEMFECMRRADLGDDSRDGDPTVQSLEGLAAERTGKQAAIFLPSGTMANLVALLAHATRGGQAVLEAESHILISEMGAVSIIAGLSPTPIEGARGAMNLENLRSAIQRTLSRNRLNTAVICMETSHNQAGGAVLPLSHMAAVFGLARENDIPVHTDGARLFNAACALRVGADRIAAHSDSVCFCLSKGLSAPAGSMLAGSAAFIERARAFRRMVGGNLRQAGVLAAAGIVSLNRMTARLVEDHRTARELAEGLHRIELSLIDPVTVETNIVRVDVGALGRGASFWSAEMRKRNVRVAPQGKTALRFVTHRHIDSGSVQEAVRAFEDIWHEVRNGDARAEAGAEHA